MGVNLFWNGIKYGSKKIKNRSETLIFILAILGILVVVNYFGVRMFTRFDMTAGKEYSISPATKNP